MNTNQVKGTLTNAVNDLLDKYERQAERIQELQEANVKLVEKVDRLFALCTSLCRDLLNAHVSFANVRNVIKAVFKMVGIKPSKKISPTSVRNMND